MINYLQVVSYIPCLNPSLHGHINCGSACKHECKLCATDVSSISYTIIPKITIINPFVKL